MATAMSAIRYRAQYSLSVPPVATHHRVIRVASTSRVAARNRFAGMVSYGRARSDQNAYTADRTRTARARGRTAGRIPLELRYATAPTATTAMRTSAMDRSVRHSSGDSDPRGAPAPEVPDRLIPPPVEKGQIPETGYPKGISDLYRQGLSRSATPRTPGGVSARGDDVDQAGRPADHLADLSPVEEPPGVLRGQGELSTGRLVCRGVDLQAVPDLPRHLDHQGHTLLAGELGVERGPRGDVNARLVPEGLPPQLIGQERREGPEHLRHGRGRLASAPARVKG